MTFISENNLAALLGTSSATIKGWAGKGKYKSFKTPSEYQVSKWKT